MMKKHLEKRNPAPYFSTNNRIPASHSYATRAALPQITKMQLWGRFPGKLGTIKLNFGCNQVVNNIVFDHAIDESDIIPDNRDIKQNTLLLTGAMFF